MTYRYNTRYFAFDVTAIGIACAVLAIAAAVGLLTTPWLPRFVLVLILIVCAYQVLNTFIAIANPAWVDFDDEGVAFGAYGREDRYPWSEVRELSVREFPGKERMYVRINGGGILHGRYWVRTGRFEDGDELYDAMVAKELEIHPDGLKARARRGY